MSYFLEFEIPGLPETVNSVLSMRLRERMRRKQFWKQQVLFITAGKRPAKPLKRAKLTLTRFSSSQPDPDGLTSSFKYIIDGLVISKVL